MNFRSAYFGRIPLNTRRWIIRRHLRWGGVRGGSQGNRRARFQNFFLTDKQQKFFPLLIIPADKPFKTRCLSSQLGCARLSFAPFESDADASEGGKGYHPLAGRQIALFPNFLFFFASFSYICWDEPIEPLA